jgi:hypothetical protein
MAELSENVMAVDKHFQRHRNAPNDLVLKRYDHRIYLSPRSKIPKHSASLQNTYFRSVVYDFSVDVFCKLGFDQ